jgi:hypothetical protein
VDPRRIARQMCILMWWRSNNRLKSRESNDYIQMLLRAKMLLNCTVWGLRKHWAELNPKSESFIKKINIPFENTAHLKHLFLNELIAFAVFSQQQLFVSS